MFRYLLSFFLFSGGGHIDQNGIFDYNVKKKKKKKKNNNSHPLLKKKKKKKKKKNQMTLAGEKLIVTGIRISLSFADIVYRS